MTKLETLYPHAVAALRAERKAKSMRVFQARGSRVKRCERCRIAKPYCICEWQSAVDTRVGVCLLMYDSEPLKPTNTGWLIADIVQDTFAYSWSRVGNMQAVIDLVNSPDWQPYLVFPGEYAAPERVTEQVVLADASKRPLFILLDATWPEARKMFRKSPYLDKLPVLNLRAEQYSRYQLRRSCNPAHLCTAEVAALCLAQAGETQAAVALDKWFDLFILHYLAAKKSNGVDV